MATPVTDSLSNSRDQIANAAEVLKRSERLQCIFEAVCRGGTRPKTVTQLMGITGYTQVAVLQLGGKLSDTHLIHKTKVGKETAYGKERFMASNRQKILRLAKNPTKLNSFPTKVSPRSSASQTVIRVSALGTRPRTILVTCDDLDEFSAVKKVKSAEKKIISERNFKDGILRLIGDTGDFQDWGGEKNDLYSSKIRFKGKRRAVAFAFKGPGTRGILTPRKLGKNGNQIQRLFSTPAEVFLVQYHDGIHEDVLEQMKAFAIWASVKEGGKPIWYGVIDGDDSNRLIAAYPSQFFPPAKKKRKRQV